MRNIKTMDSCSIIIKFWLFQQHLTNYTVVTQTVPVESKKKCSCWNHFAIVFHQAKQSRLANPLQSSSLSVCTISAVARRRCCGAPCRRCSAAIATWLATRTILRTASLSSSTKRSATCDRQPPGCRRHQYREQRRHRWRRSDLVRRLSCVASLCSRRICRACSTQCRRSWFASPSTCCCRSWRRWSTCRWCRADSQRHRSTR